MNSSWTTLLALVIAIPSFTVQPVYGDEVADLQGKWEMVIKQPGIEHRVIKTIVDRTETVEVFTNGQLQQKHVVDFAIEIVGPVKIFKWTNGRIIGGPNAGANLPDGRFIFRLKDKEWIAIQGMLEGDQAELTIERFERPEKAPSSPKA